MPRLLLLLIIILAAGAIGQAPTTQPCPGDDLTKAQLRELVQHVTVESKRTDKAEEQLMALRVELAETRGGRQGILATIERLATIIALGLSAYAVVVKSKC